MSKVETVKIYRCDYCRYYSVSHSATKYHEKRCNKNPKNKHACFGCEHLAFGFSDENIKCMTCKAKNLVMHSNKTAERVAKNFFGRKPVGELMPYECDLYKLKDL